LDAQLLVKIHHVPFVRRPVSEPRPHPSSIANAPEPRQRARDAAKPKHG